MRSQVRIAPGIFVLGVLAAAAAPARSALSEDGADARQARVAAKRGLEFLLKDAAKWREDRECSTCHHGTMTVWALSEAKRQGYEVAPETFAETVKWTKDRLLERIDLPRDERPGWRMVNTPGIYLSLMALSVPGQDAVSAGELKRIASHLLRHQETDGSWACSSAPPKNRPPPVFESDEVATLSAYTALGPLVPADPKERSDVRDAREKAAAWLAKTPLSETTQAAVLRLLVKARSGAPAESLEPDIEGFLGRQNDDGGWGQLDDAPSDAYATGQALYVLGLVGVPSERAEARRGAAFLIGTQKEDGSWPMSGRSHAGATPSKNLVPITYFGSAWATLALMRTTPGPGSAGDAARERKAGRVGRF
jgi:hypothetical protein